LPGDIVSTELSRRFCELQNANLPAGQSPWRPGASWAKLYADVHGIEMLFERHGHAVCATLMACESPEDMPVLAPVRNVLRAGRMLFGGAVPAAPHVSGSPISCDGAEIAADAATTVATATASGVSCPNTVDTNVTSVTIGPYQWATTVVLTATGAWEFSTGANADGLLLSEGIFPIPGSGGRFQALRHDPLINSQPASQNTYGAFADEYTFNLPANMTQTYYLVMLPNFGQATSSVTVTGAVLKGEIIKR
jgi:hypothetical protein